MTDYLCGGGEAAPSKVSKAVFKKAESAHIQALLAEMQYFENDENYAKKNGNAENALESLLSSNVLLRYKCPKKDGKKTSDIRNGKYIILDAKQFISVLNGDLPCRRFVMPNPTDSLTIIGRDMLNYCSNYGVE